MNELGQRRRRFLRTAAVGAGVLALPAGAAAKAKGKPADVPPTEDLMREHGVLRRLLLVYDEAARSLLAKSATSLDAIAGAAAVVRRFVEGYHEKLEEDFVLPTLVKSGRLVDLTQTIRIQHQRGRRLTESILAAARSGTALGAGQRSALLADLQSFGRMYTAHTAWEDTEIFPAYRQLFSEKELDALGDKFEEQEHKLLGASGFEGSLREVGDLEKVLGINDLGHYTPA
jgi:hemerythrin-like domain-containing protein